MSITYEWRGTFVNPEVNALHADAFETTPCVGRERDWVTHVDAHSLGWVTARDGAGLVGFVNVISDGVDHAWLQDTMVARNARGEGIGSALVAVAHDQARLAGCAWLHVDFDDHLASFYIDACGFAPTSAGLIALR
jgi:GNAT superfamily N-acetyltransferase